MNTILIVYVSMGLGMYLTDVVTRRNLIKKEFKENPRMVVLAMIVMFFGDMLLWPLWLILKEEIEVL